MGDITNIKEIAAEFSNKEIEVVEEKEVEVIIIETCKECGEPTYISENGVTAVNRCSCYWRDVWKLKTEKYRELCIFDKDVEEKTFKNAKITNELELSHKQSLERFCNMFDELQGEGYKLTLAGKPGTGKTYYTACIYNELKNKYKVINFNIQKYFSEIKKSDDWEKKESDLLKLIESSDLVMIDDLGSEQISDKWGKGKLYNLIDTIYRKKVNLIISTNFQKEALKDFLMFNGSDKIVDRLREKAKYYKFDWKSRRITKADDIPF